MLASYFDIKLVRMNIYFIYKVLYNLTPISFVM